MNKIAPPIEELIAVDPMRELVMAVFKWLIADFGEQFTRSVTNKTLAESWKWRLLERLDGVDPEVVQEGYERAVQKHYPNMPQLIHIATECRELHKARMEEAQQVAASATAKARRAAKSRVPEERLTELRGAVGRRTRDTTPEAIQ